MQFIPVIYFVAIYRPCVWSDIEITFTINPTGDKVIEVESYFVGMSSNNINNFLHPSCE